MKTLALWARLLLLAATFIVVAGLGMATAHATEEMSIEEWSFKALQQIAPPEKVVSVSKNETIDDVKARYASIARDVATVLETEKPLFSGPKGRFQTAALLLSIGFFESGFSKRVSTGELRGDGGRSWCYMQINIGDGPVYFGTEEMQTWKGRDLIDDPQKCFRAGLVTIRRSIGACRNQKGGDLLSAYTSGKCRDNEPKARARWSFATTILQRTPPTKKSEEKVASND